MNIRRANERGLADHGWLKSAHTFSFAEYYDPAFMSFRALRVLNEDYIAPQSGFPIHPHRDMEILTYVVSGEVTHQDTLGSREKVRPGEIQVMSAGTGVAHSEFNLHSSETLHLYQIWILPRTQGLKPRYEQKVYNHEEAQKDWVHLVSPTAQQALVSLDQDVHLWTTRMKHEETRSLKKAKSRFYWLQVVSGEIQLQGERASAGDAIYGSYDQLTSVELESLAENTHLLYFDLA